MDKFCGCLGKSVGKCLCQHVEIRVFRIKFLHLLVDRGYEQTDLIVLITFNREKIVSQTFALLAMLLAKHGKPMDISPLVPHKDVVTIAVGRKQIDACVGLYHVV